MPTAAGKTLYYAVHVSNRATSRRGTGWVWGPLLDFAAAKAEAKAVLAAGDATLSFVIRADADGKRVVCIYPNSAQSIIHRYRDLVARLED